MDRRMRELVVISVLAAFCSGRCLQRPLPTTFKTLKTDRPWTGFVTRSLKGSWSGELFRQEP